MAKFNEASYKKGEVWIRLFNKENYHRIPNAYLFQKDGIDFAVHHSYWSIKHKLSHPTWVVTEVSTGCAVCEGRTRYVAVGLLTPTTMEKVKTALATTYKYDRRSV